MTEVVFNLDRFKSKRKAATTAPTSLDPGEQQAKRRAKLPRHHGLWASVPLEVLANRRQWGLIPARLRLLLYVQIRSRRGQQPMALTNAMAEEIGLDRKQKWVCLASLEADGYVVVERAGKKTPIVASCPWSAEGSAVGNLPTGCG
jgi:hypothetical protein